MGKYQDNPWLGLESYRENQTMYGRNVEIEELSQYVLNNHETVLFGKSGVGKSSIINAGILPIVRKQGYIPVVIRLDHSGQQSYTAQVAKQIEEEVMVSECTISKTVDQQLLWEYFHTHRFCNHITGEPSKLLVIFDQFEEIFTLQKNVTGRKNFFKDMGDVLNNMMPREVADKVQSQDNEAQNVKTEKKVISDFTDIDSFFADIDDTVINYADKYIDDNVIHFIFTIREDSLSEFEYYTAKIPTLKQHRYNLRPLNGTQACEIITKPSPGLVSLEVAKLIISKVRGMDYSEQHDVSEMEVNAVVLSLYMSRLYEEMAENSQSVISTELVNERGADIIPRFYMDSIAPLSMGKRELLERLLMTEDNRRNNVSVDYFCDHGFTDEDIRYLVDEVHLLHRFSMHGVPRLELMHDVLCPVIVEHQKQREVQAQKDAWIKNRTRMVYVGCVFALIFYAILFGGMMLWKWRSELKEKERRLAALELSVTNYTLNTRLDNQEVYGAMRILLNTIENEQCVDSIIAGQSLVLNLFLQSIWGCLTGSYPQCLAKKYAYEAYADESTAFLLSRDGRWIAFDEGREGLCIYDAYTLNEAIVYDDKISCPLLITDFAAAKSHPKYGEYAECLALVGDSILLDVCFGTTPEVNNILLGTRLRIAPQEKITDAYYANNDSLIVLVHPKEISLWDATSGALCVDQERPFLPCGEIRYRNDSITMGPRSYYSKPGGEIELVVRESSLEGRYFDFTDIEEQCKKVLGPFWKYSGQKSILDL